MYYGSFTNLWTKPPHHPCGFVSSEFILQELWWEVMVRSEQYTHQLVSHALVWSQDALCAKWEARSREV